MEEVFAPPHGRGLTPSFSDQQYGRYDHRSARDDYAATVLGGKLLLGLTVVGVVLLIAIWRRRKIIATRIDNNVVDTLAAGIRVSRKISQRTARLRDRAIERADAPPSSERRTPD